MACSWAVAVVGASGSELLEEMELEAVVKAGPDAGGVVSCAAAWFREEATIAMDDTTAKVIFFKIAFLMKQDSRHDSGMRAA